LDNHKSQIANLIKLKDDGVLNVKDVENKTPICFFNMYQTVFKIVSENGLIKQEEEKSRDKIEFAMKTAVNLQTTLMAQNNQNQWNMKAFLAVLKQDFEASFGSALS
jgi:serine phosphatase RsbU (regulator of sigma subunit)